jgi:hypothetical protein
MQSDRNQDRRAKSRFGICRELRYKLLEEGMILESGLGHTIDIGSGGVAFTADRQLKRGAFLELSISWPVLLDESCPMRLSIFGRVLRSDDERAVCSVDKYEFRTQARVFHNAQPVRSDSMLQRWADAIRRGNLRSGTASA